MKGIIYIYVADEYKGDLNMSSSEGILEWIKIDDNPIQYMLTPEKE